MLPFDRYAGKGQELLGPPALGDGTCRHGYGPPVFGLCGSQCAYCGEEMGESYRSWLHLSVDHVIPRSVKWYAEHGDWIEDMANLVTCCRACNEFLNGYRVTDDPPANLSDFLQLRDCHFQRKRAHALQRHRQEEAAYQRWRDECTRSGL